MDMKQTEIILAALKFKIAYLEDRGCLTYEEGMDTEKNWTITYRMEGYKRHLEKQELIETIKKIEKIQIDKSYSTWPCTGQKPIDWER